MHRLEAAIAPTSRQLAPTWSHDRIDREPATTDCANVSAVAPAMSTAAKKEWLKSVPLFSTLSENELEALAAAAGSIAVQKHGRVFEEGSPGDCCFVLTAGEARVVLSGDDDTEMLLATIRPRMIVGELALLDDSPRSAALVATQPCRFLTIPAVAFQGLRQNATFEQRLVKHVASRLRETNEHIKGVSSGSAVARVAWCLSRVARQEGRLDRGGILIPKKAHQELADMAGCSRETVTRALGTLRKKRCVSWTGKTMRLEVEALQRYARTELRTPA